MVSALFFIVQNSTKSASKLNAKNSIHSPISISISDFDGDGFIGASDIENAVKLLTQNELNHEEIESVWEKVSLTSIYQIEVVKLKLSLNLNFTGPC